MYDRLSDRRARIRRTTRRNTLRFLVPLLVIGLPALCFCSYVGYQVPAVNERLSWRIEALRADVKYALNPPEEQVFVPEGQIAGRAPVTPFALPTATDQPTPTPTPGPTETPSPSPTVTFTPTAIPAQAKLEGVPHYYQMWNNCGPANLAMALSFWGWEGDQRDTAAFLKPNPRDKNVMPYEMADYVEQETDLRVVSRVNGDLEILKAFLSAGFPVVVEKGFEGPGFDGWMGHYLTLTGYEDERQIFRAQDSYKGPDQVITYEDLVANWRAFNFTYIVPYPALWEPQVQAILGPNRDLQYTYEQGAGRALAETKTLSGRDLFFAWYNRGANLVALHDYANAATAFDAAFANYAKLSQQERPWRMVWYSTGPYFAYFYSQRYEDVINLATATLEAASEPVLEESYYWRARAKGALGDVEGAVEDYQESLEAHPDFGPSLDELRALGVEP